MRRRRPGLWWGSALSLWACLAACGASPAAGRLTEADIEHAAATVDYGDYSSETLTVKAWKALEAEQYPALMAYTRETVKRYGKEGRRMNDELGGFLPAEKAAEPWALNDVGTSLFIMGTAYAKLEMWADAVTAFETLLAEYTYAQCWDPKGWHWHVAKAAREKLPSYREQAGLPASPSEPAKPATPSPRKAAAEEPKRGAAFHFCGWPSSHGDADLAAMVPGLSWYYNWSSRPLTCADGKGVGASPHLTDGTVEFVPMAWGLVDDGAACESGGACFRVDERRGGAACEAACAARGGAKADDARCYDCQHEGISRADFLADVPSNARHLLGFNEPNFKEQANLTPGAAAEAWRHLEWVADAKKLKLVGPATNFCDPTPGARHPGACIEAVDGVKMLGTAWLERFYDACSASGAAGHDCRMEYQAVHAYSCYSVHWMIELMKAKAGTSESSKPHCRNGAQDEDEFGVDCGGTFCRACSSHARKMFARPVWLTEFSPPQKDCGTDDADALVQHAIDLLDKDLPRFSDDPYVYRYAWFMPRVSMPSLDHNDLLQSKGELTRVGRRYFGRD